MDYDVLILGGGIIGCAIAYELSKYNLNIALIEKDYDVANDLALTNTTLIYDGSEAVDKNMAQIEAKGMELIRRHCHKFNISYNKVGSMRISSNRDRCNNFDQIYKNAKEWGIEGIYILEDESIYQKEPNLDKTITKALYSENTALISSYNLAISYAEVATDNGVKFRLEEEVIDIKSISKGFKVTTTKNKFTCKYVINTIPNDISMDNQKDIKDKQMNSLLLNEKFENSINNIIINDIDDNKFIVSIFNLAKQNEIEVLKNPNKELVENIFNKSSSDDNINDVFIDEHNLENGYIKVIGNYYSKITIAPVIALDIENKLKTSMNITKKKDYIDKRRDVFVFRNMSNEQRNKIIALDSRYGNIICNCNCISEGEIVDSIRRPLGARTLEGVKRRTGVGFGGCNGSDCNMKIIKILAREMNKGILNIVDECVDSNILIGRIKEFNEI